MYIELHARSAFSFLEGASVPEEFAEVCSQHEMPAMALLDRDGVYGAPRFYLAAQKLKLKAHIGAEITSLFPGGDLANPAELPRLSLLCASREGYQNLCRLITRTKLRAPKYPASLPRRKTKLHNDIPQCEAEELVQYQSTATLADLAEYSPGLICLTGGDEGPLAHALERGGLSEARAQLERLVSLYGGENVYVELQRHYNRAQEARNQAAIELARSLQLPLLATQGAQYARPQERQILDVFTCIRNHRTLDTAGRLLARNSERHLKTPQQMMQLFAGLPEASANTLELSSRLEFTLHDLGYEFPRYPVSDGETMDSFLRARTLEGARNRYLRPGQGELWQRARRQIERELMLIEKLKLAGYFLIVWDIVRHCREHGILVQGRGSAANSAVCYSLGITAVDPVGMDLLFERFLSEERGEWPDIDLDLPSGDQRERAIQYVYERYGKLGAAMTANVITYRGRSAAREVGKALSFDGETLDRLAGLVSSWEYKDPGDTLERQFRDAGFDLRHPRIRKFFELCLAVQDLPRHLGQHSGGMVICQGQLDSIVPLEPATMPGRVVVQWDKEDCADMGIVKVDLLGLGMMAVLEDSITLIRNHCREEVDLAKLPADDPTVYDTLQKADTVGMFQIESRAQMSCLPRLRPTHFYDIVVQVAIIRPGPIVGQMVNPYLMRRQGRQAVVYPHPSLEPVLERTLGVPLFQEQLLRVAMITAGFSGGEAEELRRAFGFKRSEKRMRDIEVKLREGMTRNGIPPAAQQEIIQSITSFALYGFPESHAASFALIAYASAYLKCHYLAAFTAALLNNQPMGFYSPATIVKDAQRHGLRVKPVDITRSEWLCTLEGEKDLAMWNGAERREVDRNRADRNGAESNRAERNCAEADGFEGARLQPFRKLPGMGSASAAEETRSSYQPEAPRRLKPVSSDDRYGTAKAVPFQNDEEASGAPFDKLRASSEGAPLQSRRFALRMGLRYAKGLREETARAILREREKRPFESIADLAYRVPQLRRDEFVLLASIGALNSIGCVEGVSEQGRAGLQARVPQRRTKSVQALKSSASSHELQNVMSGDAGLKAGHELVEGPRSTLHRRDALWQVERAARFAGPLLESIPESDSASPLARMSDEERLVADFHGTGLTVGPHPMSYRRAQLRRARVLSAEDLKQAIHGRRVRTAGCVIARQRPGTAKGFVFLSLEDETGISNAIITPDILEQNRVLITTEKFLLLEGVLQKQEGVISVKVDRVRPMRKAYAADNIDITDADVRSHDFH
ncbi:MAG TPA: error-prone DNA polymerase [Terriglobales bacterium]|nr:error-prone DNA polymerase [Terriglobales bacterium]